MVKRSGTGQPDFIRLGYKIWLEKDKAILGAGLFKLLSQILGLGSISQAAKVMGMSYRAAWGKIKMAEKRLGIPLVITQVGGEMGGGARLTPEAEELLNKFDRLWREVDNFAESSFKEIFKGWTGP
jgi:molybdate transport system regulatory protein